MESLQFWKKRSQKDLLKSIPKQKIEDGKRYRIRMYRAQDSGVAEPSPELEITNLIQFWNV
jgi:hypothetical protein